jgi:hypothetical protein
MHLEPEKMYTCGPQNSQSEHWDEDVLNLRNTLLQVSFLFDTHTLSVILVIGYSAENNLVSVFRANWKRRELL